MYSNHKTPCADRMAFVHCWIQPGGAWNVCQDIIAACEFAQGAIFTIYSDITHCDVAGQTLPVVTALPRWVCRLFRFFRMHHTPILSSLLDYRNLFPLFPLLTWRLSYKIRRRGPQYAVISSFAVAKNVSLGDCPSTLYLHSPMQYVHTHYDEYLEKLSGFKKTPFLLTSLFLRNRDLRKSLYSSVFFNSQFTKNESHTLYGLSGQVCYPVIAREWFTYTNPLICDNYYIYFGRVVRFVKELDRIIELFRDTDDRLLIVGSGPDQEMLSRMSPTTISFVGWVSETEQQIDLLARACGLINITKESFGIATAQSLLVGTPVFGYCEGASAELVDGSSGVLVPDKAHTTLCDYFAQFKQKSFDRKAIQHRARMLFSSTFRRPHEESHS